jgi:hypothetical protein
MILYYYYLIKSVPALSCGIALYTFVFSSSLQWLRNALSPLVLLLYALLLVTKFKQMMSAYQKQNLEILCKFRRNINKSFVL